MNIYRLVLGILLGGGGGGGGGEGGVYLVLYWVTKMSQYSRIRCSRSARRFGYLLQAISVKTNS